MRLKKVFSWLGPGLLYAAAAIGVSHLVQSTRAGASFGYELLWAIVIANFLKYPFFKNGPLYTLYSNESLLAGYRRIGSWAIYLFFMITLGTIFTVQAAITIVTAGLANQFFGLALNPVLMSFILLLVCSVILIIGNYKLLDNIIKIIIIVLSLTTLIAVIMSLNSTSLRPTVVRDSFSFLNNDHIFFLVALIGWMPGPLDLPIWQSLWTLEKQQQLNKPKLKNSLLDFNIGYIGTALLAICFLTLGAQVMYPTGIEFSGKANEFSSQLIQLYTDTIGSWSYPIILICSFSTMFSTCLTCMDAFPRILREGVIVLDPKLSLKQRKLYLVFLGVVFFWNNAYSFKLPH